VLSVINEQFRIENPALTNEYPLVIAAQMRGLVEQLETLFRYRPMPVSVADTMVPGFIKFSKPIGKATIFDYLFTDQKIPQ
jgi:hypothetical protein